MTSSSNLKAGFSNKHFETVIICVQKQRDSHKMNEAVNFDEKEADEMTP